MAHDFQKKGVFSGGNLHGLKKKGVGFSKGTLHGLKRKGGFKAFKDNEKCSQSKPNIYICIFSRALQISNDTVIDGDK